MKEEIHFARRDFCVAYRKPPTKLFVSPEFHTGLCEFFRNRLALFGEKSDLKSLVGARMFGMEVHLVPTLTEGFHVA